MSLQSSCFILQTKLLRRSGSQTEEVVATLVGWVKDELWYSSFGLQVGGVADGGKIARNWSFHVIFVSHMGLPLNGTLYATDSF